MRFHSILIALLSTCMCAPARAQVRSAPPEMAVTDSEVRITVPLNEDGEVNLGTLLGLLADQAGFDGELIRANCDYTTPVRGPVGAVTLGIVQGATLGAANVQLKGDHVVLVLDRIKLRDSKRDLHTGIAHLLELWFPDTVAQIKSSYGTFTWTDDNARVKASAPVDDDVVVLVHGLDEPGWIWRSLGPVLKADGFAFVEVVYPNDQSIADSAEFLDAQLQLLEGYGVQRITLVAHSMGGLVCREVLTNPTYYDSVMMGGDARPSVKRLIMIGTPNHGSSLARFQLFGEMRDQVVRALSGDGMLIGAFFDGAGEAQDDLMPGSWFLETLNSRPWPSDLPTTIIAGSASPVTMEGIDKATEGARTTYIPKYSQDIDFDSIGRSLKDAVDGLGDGCVSIESTRLEGVSDHVIVDGNHVTMIRNWTRESERVPPAVEIVLDRLRKDRRAGPGTGH